jgi:hypothetical protein
MRVLFTSMPVHSHVAPLLPLASAARQAGHEVVFFTGPAAIGQVESAGLTAVAGGPSFTETTQRYRRDFEAEVAGLTSDQRLEHFVVHLLARIAAPAMAEDLVPFARRWAPDLVTGTVAELAGEVAAAVAGVPHVTHGFGPVPPNQYAAISRDEMAPVWTRWGVETTPVDSFTEKPYLDIWPEELQPPKESWMLRWRNANHRQPDVLTGQRTSSSAIVENSAIKGLRRVLSHARQTWLGPMSQTATWTMSGRV